MKKIIMALACASVLSAAVFAQENVEGGSSVSFENKFGGDTVNIKSNSFTAGSLFEEMKVTVETDRLDAEVAARAFISRNDDGKLDGIAFDPEKFNWHIVYTPTDSIHLGLHQELFIPGSYFIIDDSNVDTGNIGSEGFTFAFTGVEGLTLASSIPFGFEPNKLKDNKGNYAFRINFGAFYNVKDLFTVGAAIHNIALDDMSAGAYVSVNAVENMNLNAGYTYNKEKADWGTHLINFSCDYKFNPCYVAIDYEMDTAKKFNSRAYFDMEFNDIWKANIKCTLNSSFDDMKSHELIAEPGVTYNAAGLGKFYFGIRTTVVNGKFDSICFPNVWTYSF